MWQTHTGWLQACTDWIDAAEPQGYRLAQPPLLQQLLEALPFGGTRRAAATAAAVRTFWRRATSDDLLYMCAPLLQRSAAARMTATACNSTGYFQAWTCPGFCN